MMLKLTCALIALAVARYGWRMLLDAMAEIEDVNVR